MLNDSLEAYNWLATLNYIDTILASYIIIISAGIQEGYVATYLWVV